MNVEYKNDKWIIEKRGTYFALTLSDVIELNEVMDFIFDRIREAMEIPKESSKPQKRRGLPSGKRKRIYKRDGNKCTKCGTSDDLTLDHIIPKSLDGREIDQNLQTMCGPCNREKGLKVEIYTKNKQCRLFVKNELARLKLKEERKIAKETKPFRTYPMFGLDDSEIKKTDREGVLIMTNKEKPRNNQD